MPRKNSNHIHDHSPKKRGGGNNKQQKKIPKINWEQARAEHYGTEMRPEPRAIRPTTIELPDNKFTRHLEGFSDQALEILLHYGFEKVDPQGFIPVRFKGISSAPKKEIICKNPAIVTAPGGLVISTVVERGHIEDIGNGSAIEQLSAPDMDSHDSSKRFNVALGSKPVTRLGLKDLSAALTEDLTLSGVMLVNDVPVRPGATQESIQTMWNRAEAVL